MIILLLFNGQEAKNATYPCAHYNRAYKSLKDFTLPHSAFEKKLLKCVLFSYFCRHGSKMFTYIYIFICLYGYMFINPVSEGGGGGAKGDCAPPPLAEYFPSFCLLRKSLAYTFFHTSFS